MSEVRLGVFICDCGEQVSSILDVDFLEKQILDLPEVSVSRRLRFSCSPDGLVALQATITEKGLNRVLVAGCTPRTLAPRFRDACEEVGLDRDLFEMVDIREGCAWVHQDKPQEATAKAFDLIRMGAARAVLRKASQPVSARIVPAALIIGGGLAGMTAALTLADTGLPVKLVEREASLGGMLGAAHTLYPDRRCAARYVGNKVEAITNHPRIDVLLERQVTEISGTAGHYTVCVDGTSPHKNEGSIFDVGAIIVATGAHPVRPLGLFKYDGRRVVTQYEFERELHDHANNTPSAGLPDKVVMILCAGQRDQTIPYCSGVCCMSGLKQAMEVKAANPEAAVTILFRDLYLLGEEIYEYELSKAQQAGVEFIRYKPSTPPQVADEVVTVHDELTGREFCLPYDRVVLAAPLVPQPDAGKVAHMLGISRDENGFFPEVRYRLRPQNYVERGIYVCGAAHHPAGWDEAEFQATSAAFHAMRYLQAVTITRRSPVVFVDEKLCTGCGSCIEACAFNALSMREREGMLALAQVDPLLCEGCGNCVVTCPVRAINISPDGDMPLLAQIEEALATAPQDKKPRILVFGCEWSSHAAAELAGFNKIRYPVETRLIQLGCSIRFDPIHVLWAFLNGADGVFLGACPPGDCHYVNGNRYAQERIDTLRELLVGNGFDPRRLRLEWIVPDDPDDFVGKITSFTNLIRNLGPSPIRSE